LKKRILGKMAEVYSPETKKKDRRTCHGGKDDGNLEQLRLLTAEESLDRDHGEVFGAGKAIQKVNLQLKNGFSLEKTGRL